MHRGPSQRNKDFKPFKCKHIARHAIFIFFYIHILFNKSHINTNNRNKIIIHNIDQWSKGHKTLIIAEITIDQNYIIPTYKDNFLVKYKLFKGEPKNYIC